MNGLGKNKSKDQGKRDARGDDFTVEIKLVQSTQAKSKKSDKAIEKTVFTGSGSWLSHLMINNEVCWRIEDPPTLWLEPEMRLSDNSPLLASDSRFRGDLDYIRS